MRSPTAVKSPVVIDYHEVTRNELVDFQRSRPNADDIGARVAAEAFSLMGLARYWRKYGAEADAEIVRLREALSRVLGTLSAWRPIQPSPDPTDCSAGYPEFIRRAWSDAVDVLGDDGG